MTNQEQTFKRMLKENALSMTTPRLLIFNLLNNQIPLTINEIIIKVGETIDRVSVYRTINAFENIGIVQRVNLGWKYKIELSDMFQDHHHHLICLKCSKITPIHDQALESYLLNVASLADFQTKNHQIEIQGYCKDCKSQATN
ncbi:MAG TPA: Fur family transcriptional regulator [Candidatus Saccharimonadales bacterium]